MEKRYQIRVGDHKIDFHYDADTQTWRARQPGTQDYATGQAVTLEAARDAVRRYVQDEKPAGESLHPQASPAGTGTIPGAGPGRENAARFLPSVHGTAKEIQFPAMGRTDRAGIKLAPFHNPASASASVVRLVVKPGTSLADAGPPARLRGYRRMRDRHSATAPTKRISGRPALIHWPCATLALRKITGRKALAAGSQPGNLKYVTARKDGPPDLLSQARGQSSTR